MRQEGANINKNDDATTKMVEINSVTATILLAANPLRLYAAVYLVPDVVDVEVFVRKYAFDVDNIMQGAVLIRETLGNNNLFVQSWETKPSNIYSGEISAISKSGTFSVIVEEF